jgi:hypothetical protein
MALGAKGGQAVGGSSIFANISVCVLGVGWSCHWTFSTSQLKKSGDCPPFFCDRISSGVGRVVTGTFTHVRSGLRRGNRLGQVMKFRLTVSRRRTGFIAIFDGLYAFG